MFEPFYVVGLRKRFLFNVQVAEYFRLPTVDNFGVEC